MPPFDIDNTKSFILNNETWVCRIPTPKERRMIDVETGRRLQGCPLESLPANTYNYTLFCVTLNLCITHKPIAYQSIKDFEDYHDQDFVMELYEQFAKAFNQFQEELENLKKNTNNGKPVSGSMDKIQTQPTTTDTRNVSTANDSNNGSGNEDRGLQSNYGIDTRPSTVRRTGKAQSIRNPS